MDELLGTPRRVLLAADPAAAWRAASGSLTFDEVWSPAQAQASGSEVPPAGSAARRSSLHAHARRWSPPEADELVGRRLLLQAVGEVFGHDDAGGYAAVGAGAVRQFLRVADHDAPFPLDDDPRTERWWTVAQRYRQALRAKGLVDPAEVVRAAAQRMGQGAATAGRLAVVGYLDLAPDEVMLVDAAAGPGSLLILPWQPGWTDANQRAVVALEARGWSVRRSEGPVPGGLAGQAADPGKVRAVALPTLEAEARWVIGQAKALLAAGMAASDLVFTAREHEHYAEAMLTAAWEAGVPLRIERRLPLERLRGGGALAAWLAAVADDGAFEATLAFLAHPLVGRLSVEEIARLRRWRPSNPRAWARGLADPTLLEVLAWPARDDPAGWQRRLSGAWWGLGLLPRSPGADGSTAEEPGAVGPAPFDPATHPQLGAHPELMAALAEAMAQLPALAGSGGRVTRAAVLRLLREALRYLTVPDPQGEDHPSPLWLRPLEAVLGSEARQVFLLGAVEGWFPLAVQDDPVLGSFERARLAAAGLPIATAGDAARRETLLAWGLRAADGRSICLTVPAQTGSDARLPSVLLARWGLAVREPEPRPPSTPQAFRSLALRHGQLVPDAVDPVLALARSAYAQLWARELLPEWGPDDGFVGLPFEPDDHSWSASQLLSLSGCRFRWWLQRVWGLSAPEEGATELTPVLKGRLYHATLERALRPAAIGLAGEEARAAALARLEQAFAEAEALDRLDDAVPNWLRWREEHLANLRGLLRSEAFLPSGRTLLEIERSFEGEWRGWRVTGRVDRIDRGPDGLHLLDLKLGSSAGALARDAELEPRLDLQLPLYREVAAPDIAPDEVLASASYFSLSKQAEIRVKAPEEADLEELFARLRASLRAGFFPVEPHPDVCRRCDLELVCRKGPPPHAHLLRKPPPYRVPS